MGKVPPSAQLPPTARRLRSEVQRGRADERAREIPMRWSCLRDDRSMRVRRSNTHAWPASPRRPPATYSGFDEAVPNLYEFRTSDGYCVYLHEMDCVGISFEPISRRLALTFECVASDLMDPLTLVLTFDETRISEWRDVRTDEATLVNAGSRRVRGQVSDLGQLGDADFGLQLLDVYVSFEARSVRCNVVPGVPSQGSSEP